MVPDTGVIKDLTYYKRRYKSARSKADLWTSLLETCYHYTNPSRNLYYWTSQYQGAQKNAKVYETTAVAARRTFASKIHNTLTPPQQIWAGLVAGSRVPEDQKDAINKQLQEITNILFDYLHHSNFDIAMAECYDDLAIGTAVLIINEGYSDDEPLLFYSVPLARVAIEDSINGLPETIFHWWDEVQVSQIKEMWPNAKLSATMEAMLRADPMASVKQIVEGCVYFHNHRTGKKYYTYIVFADDMNEMLLEEDRDSSEFIAFRWSKLNNEVMGRGPVIDALPSILSLNELFRIELKSANFNISKPYMAYSDGIFNPWTFQLEPNTVIPVAPNASGQFPIMPFPDNANPEFMQVTANDLRTQIHQLMYSNPLGPIEDPSKTATELALRQKNMADEIGPVYTRLVRELCAPIIDRSLHVLQKKGLIPRIEVNGKEIKIKYQSPLIFAQGKNDIERFMNWVQVLQSVYGESAAMFIHPSNVPEWTREKLGVDPSLMPDKEQIEEMLAAESNKQQEMEMASLEQMQGAPQNGGQLQPGNHQ